MRLLCAAAPLVVDQQPRVAALRAHGVLHVAHVDLHVADAVAPSHRSPDCS